MISADNGALEVVKRMGKLIRLISAQYAAPWVQVRECAGLVITRYVQNHQDRWVVALEYLVRTNHFPCHVRVRKVHHTESDELTWVEALRRCPKDWKSLPDIELSPPAEIHTGPRGSGLATCVCWGTEFAEWDGLTPSPMNRHDRTSINGLMMFFNSTKREAITGNAAYRRGDLERM